MPQFMARSYIGYYPWLSTRGKEFDSPTSRQVMPRTVVVSIGFEACHGKVRFLLGAPSFVSVSKRMSRYLGKFELPK